MKIKFSFGLPGLLALVVAGSPLLTVYSVSAKEAAPATMQKKQPSMKERINLSADQAARIKKIRQDTQKAVEGILSKEQKAKYAQARKSGMKPDKALASLGLSKDQKTKIKGILDGARQQISGVLTKKQQATLKESRGQGRPDEL
jgi:Spy/CpxP family protein refolding chaperone